MAEIRNLRSRFGGPVPHWMGLLILLGGAAAGLVPPGALEREKAIGPLESLPPELARALKPNGTFVPVPRPGPSDWLANHSEKGQTFAEFRAARPNRPDGRRKRLYLQPLGEFRPGESPALDQLQVFAAAFFGVEVKTLPALDVSGGKITSRLNPAGGQRQLLAGDLLGLLQGQLPEDAFAVLGITMEDLYPDDSWNFVFGQASLRNRVGVYSFARYHPRFHGEQSSAETKRLLLRRSCKVLAHETAHMFGIEHCIYYHCLMNGSNHLRESDERPMYLCPVDLRKLQDSVGFNVVEHYRGLHEFCERAGLQADADWYDRRLSAITATQPAP